jgi:hypothetical protein
MLLQTATGEAEQFLNTDFDGIEAPAPVKTWVFNRVYQLYDSRGNHSRPEYTLLQTYRVYPFKGSE